MGDSNLIVNRLICKSKINNQRFRAMVQKAQNLMNKTDIRPTRYHLNMFQHLYRDWNQEADHLTQVARENGATRNSFTMEEGNRLEAVRAYFVGGVNIQDDDKIKHKVVSAYVIQSAERIEESTEKMIWKTMVEVAKVLLGDATKTQADCTAAVEPFVVWLELDALDLIWIGIWSKIGWGQNKNRKQHEKRLSTYMEEKSERRRRG